MAREFKFTREFPHGLHHGFVVCRRTAS
jgi:hypothetical protein